MTIEDALSIAGGIVVLAPLLLVLAFCTSALTRHSPSERTSARLTEATVLCGLLAAAFVFVGMLATGSRNVEIELGQWASVHGATAHDAYHFHLKFVFDRLSVPFVLLTFVLVGTVGAFANRYLHRERGYHRFFSQYALFLLGMIVATLAGTVETLFVGWELVGLSSALLVAFFHDRPAPVRNGLRVWSIYRFADAAFLIAAVALHHVQGAGDFAALTGHGAWPYGEASLSSGAALAIGLLVLIAAAGKSALLPFSGWLPRAMEGPTPSSAVFYGALSVHLGTYLLLRTSPLLALSWTLSAAVVALGLATAAYGAVVARAQPDVKSALAFASLTQVGLITAEIGFGLKYLALVHIVGHATFRTLQLLRAPSVLHDYQALENALGERLAPGAGASLAAYRFALSRGQLDGWIDRFAVEPFIGAFRAFQSVEQRWLRWLAGEQPPQPPGDASPAVSPPSEAA